MKCIRNLILATALFPGLMSALITLDEVDSYQRNGFLVIPNFYSAEECDSLKNHVSKLVDDFDADSVREIFDNKNPTQKNDYFLSSGANTSFFFEKDTFNDDGTLKYPKELCLNKIGHAMHDLDPHFSAFIRNSNLAELTSDLGVTNPLLIQSMYIFKQPYIGGEVFCHQDSTFLISEPNTTIGYWVAIEDATLENGCLWVSPGEHTVPLKVLYVRNENQVQLQILDSTQWDNGKLIPLEVKKGTLIVLHGHLPHMSLMNTSSKSRHAFTLHVIDASSDYPALNWLQRPKDFPFTGF